MTTPQRIDIPLLEGEYWWGGCAADGMAMPYGHGRPFEGGCDPNASYNQAAPLLLSSRGRAVHAESGLSYSLKDGCLTVSSRRSPIEFHEGSGALKDACRHASAAYMTFGDHPELRFFEKPQYNTWIELGTNQTQEGVLTYARDILRHGFPAGILMIDDGWSDDYGQWTFHPGRFPNPKHMVEALHGMGFTVMLWTCPFISPDSAAFRELSQAGLLVRDREGAPAIREWWNGYSALLDLSHPQAADWFCRQNEGLLSLGVDGFKLDGGDAQYYRDDDRTHGRVTANGQSSLYARFGLRYRFNEYRACFGCGGLPLIQRQADKMHEWGQNGLGALIPTAIAQSLMGYPYHCPDMIGGGEIRSFNETTEVDQELFVRYAQAAALFPMMQFSAAPWRVLDTVHAGYCREAALLHVRMAPLLRELAEHAAKTGEPILRPMAYEYPGEGMETCHTQFMLGDRLLVAPVLEPGRESRTIRFPSGAWRGDDDTVVDGPGTQTVSTPLSRLPYYTKL